MRGFAVYAIANMKMFFRDRGAVFWSFVFPILFMGLLGLGFGRAGTIEFDMAVIDEDDTAWSGGLWQALDNESLPFAVTNYTVEADARAALEAGDLDLVVVIPRGFAAFMENQTAPDGDRGGRISG